MKIFLRLMRELSAVRDQLSDKASYIRVILMLKPKVYKLSTIGSQQSESSCYTRFIDKLIPKTYHLILFLILVFVSCGAALAQEFDVHATPAALAVSETNPLGGDRPEITPLKIGDKIPDELWEMYFPVVSGESDQVQYLSLGDFKDKLIILDFWATWCAPCIESFPKLHALQNEFGDQIKIIAVTQQKKNIIDKFFTTSVGKEHSYLRSVIDDSILSEYFPHIGVPHLAWISPDGKVLNTTRAEDITKTNIQAVLDNDKPQMASKVDIDRNRPLFLSDHFSENLELKTYSIFAKGYYPGLQGGGNFKKNRAGKIYRRQMTNVPMMEIYYPILYELFNSYKEQFNLNRAILEVRRPELLDWQLKPDGTFQHTNLYNFELVVPENKADSLFHYMLEDLNRYSDYIGTIENRLVDCLVLVRTSTNDKIQSKGGEPQCTFPSSPSILINQKLDVMINMLSEGTPITLPIVDETGYTGNVDIEISGVKDLASFKKELNRYDLDLIAVERNLNMFVLKDK